MTQHNELSREELEGQTGEELPDREAMSIVDLDGGMTAMPVPAEEEELWVPDKTHPIDHEPPPIMPDRSTG